MMRSSQAICGITSGCKNQILDSETKTIRIQYRRYNNREVIWGTIAGSVAGAYLGGILGAIGFALCSSVLMYFVQSPDIYMIRIPIQMYGGVTLDDIILQCCALFDGKPTQNTKLFDIVYGNQISTIDEIQNDYRADQRIYEIRF
jgi:hypothetical protein